MKLFFLSTLITAGLLVPQTGFALPQEPPPIQEAAAKPTRMGGGGGAGIRYHFYNPPVDAILSGYSVTSPKSSNGSGGMGWFTFPGGFMFGGGAFGTTGSVTVGSTTAEYETRISGFYFAQDLFPNEPLDLVLGSFVAYGSSRLILSTAATGGQIKEGYMVFEPCVSISYPLWKFLRLALVAAVQIPVPGTVESKGVLSGNNVHLANNVVSVGLQFVFGSRGQQAGS